MNGFFRGKMSGTVTVGDRGQLVIPADLRKEFKIQPGDKLMVFAKTDKRIISLMREEDFTRFLHKASRIISKLESEVSKD